MDDIRNRHPAFSRMPNWISEDDGMADLTSRMAHVPNWPLSMGRRGGPWRERRGSGGSAMSATSEDDSSYDPIVNDKSSQGSGGSGGLEAVTHEIPIMIEAEAPPSMMQQPTQPPAQDQRGQTVQPESNSAHQNNQQSSISGPVPPLVGQVRKTPQYATRTTSATESGNPQETKRSTRCSSAPPQMLDETDGPNARQATPLNTNPQARSATMPMNQHNSSPKPFVPTYKNQHTANRTQAPILEENVPQHQKYQQQDSGHDQQATPQQQQQQYYNPQEQPQQYHQQDPRQHYPQQQEQQWKNQPFYEQPDYEQQRWQQYYNDPRNFHEDPYYMQQHQYAPQQQQPQQRSNSRPGVIRNIPIFIEGQDNPIINEEKPSSLSSSPRTQQSYTQQQATPPQQSYFQQVPVWSEQPPFYRQNLPEQQAYHPSQQQQYYPPSHDQYQPAQPQYYTREQFRQPPQQQQQQRQQRQQPQQRQQQQYSNQQQTPRQPTTSSHEIPVQIQQSAPPPQPRQPSPQPPPLPVKLTPLQKIDQVRANNEELMKSVDNFSGTKNDREFLYLDEMLTRALISLDDIDPDGKDDIRQARKALVKDINSKISLLEKKASAAAEANTKETGGGKTSVQKEGSSEVKSDPSLQTESNPVTIENQTSVGTNPSASNDTISKEGSTTDKGTGNVSGKSLDTARTQREASKERDQSSKGCPKEITPAIPCPAPAIPLPDK